MLSVQSIISPKLILEYQLVIAELVKSQSQSDSHAMNPIRMRAKNDVLRMIGILQLSSGTDIVAKTRVAVLSEYL